MAIKVVTGQQTFVKKIVVGTPISTAQTGLSIDNFSDFKVATKSEGQILVYDSAEGAFKNFTLTVGNGLEKFNTPGTDQLALQIDSSSTPTITGLTTLGNIVPAVDSAVDLGDSAKKFRDLYLSGGTIHLGNIDLKDSSGGFAATDSTGAPVNFNLQGSIPQIRRMFAGGGDLSYDTGTGVFQFDVEQVYTKEHFDSDFNLTLDSAVLEGVGLNYSNASNTLNIDSAELEAFFKPDIRGYFTASNTLSYNSSTGDFRLPQPLDSGARPTFNKVKIPDGGLGVNDARIILGNDSDLKIFHSGSHSIIRDAGTGSLLLQTNNFTVQNATGTENQITALSGGAVTLYHNDSARLSTTDSGINVTGDLLLSNSDSSAVADPTLTFYRNSATPAFNDEMGEIIFQGRNDNSEDVHYGRIVGKIAQSSNGTEKGNIEFKIMENGTEATFVQMAFDNVFINKQLTMFNNIFLDGDYSIKWDGATNNANTTSLVVTDPTAVNTITLPDASGVVLLTDSNLTNDITFSGDVAFDSVGAVLFDKSEKTLKFGDDYKANFGDSNDLQIFHDGSNSVIKDDGTGALELRGHVIRIKNTAGTKTGLQYNQGQAIQLFYGTSKKFETTDSGVAITGQLTADSATISGGVTADTFGDGSIYTTNSVTTNILGTANVVVNTFQSSVTTTRKYLAQVKNGTKIQSQEMMLISTDSNAFLTSYAIINSDSDLGTFTADYNSGFARLRFTPTISGTNAVKLVFTDISV